MSNGMELQVLDVKQQTQFLVKQTERLDKWCKTGDVRADSLVRYALAEMEVDENLRACTPTSIYLALLACAVTGLVPGKLRGYAFLVPFTNTYGDVKRREATFMVGWRGVKHQGFRAGVDMLSAVIHRNDTFDYDVGTNGFVRSRAALEGRGPVIGAASWAKLPRNGLEVEYLDLETLQKIEAQANRLRPSPAWNGPFKDQMQRKSALRRLGKQIEMGDDFFKGQALEDGYEASGSIAGTLDELTDGDATRVLSQQSTEAAVFAGVPRPALGQVPEVVKAVGANPPAEKPAADRSGGGKKSKPIEAQATERPTSAGGASTSTPGQTATGSATRSESTTPASTSSTSSQPAASPTPPAASTAGSTNPPASSATPAASSQPASTSTPSPSVASGPAASPASNASAEGFGDVAAEPAADEAFDTSFGDDETNDPVDRLPQTRAEWIDAFRAWAALHPTREDVIADDSWLDIFKGWANSCRSQKEMDEDKPIFQNWSKAAKLTFGRKADPAKGVTAIAPDKQIQQMQDEFAKRYRAVP